MENPVFNFYSATVISGDRENISVVAHEFAHSYSGNLVTNSSWEDFWLNEGWTVYIERYILRKLRGEDDEKFQAMVGWQDLIYGIKSYGGDESPFTRLVLDFKGSRPDDVMSKISYEKGYTFLCYLESVVGKDKWLIFVPHVRPPIQGPLLVAASALDPQTDHVQQYFTKFYCKTVDSAQFKTCLLDFFASDATATEALQAVDWESWYHKPGLPLKPDFQCKLYDNCIELADKWSTLTADSTYQPSPEDVHGWIMGQFLAFLDRLIELRTPVPQKYVAQLGPVYGIDASTNLELVSRYLRVALQAGSQEAIPRAREVLAETGRMKFVRPL